MLFFSEIIKGCKTKEKTVVLTFDDGPQPVFTSRILDLLENHNVKAAFFLSGNKINDNKEIVKRMIREGHELCNHAYSHSDLLFKSAKFIKAEITSTDQQIIACGGIESRFFRPPFGRFNLSLYHTLKQMKKKLILWNIPTHDYKTADPHKIVQRVLRRLKPGGIIVLHDAGKKKGSIDRSPTLDALKILLTVIQDSGYRIKPLAELLDLS